MKLEHCARPLGEGGTEISYVVQTKPLEEALCFHNKEVEEERTPLFPGLLRKLPDFGFQTNLKWAKTNGLVQELF